MTTSSMLSLSSVARLLGLRGVVIVITFLFIKLQWLGDREESFRSSFFLSLSLKGSSGTAPTPSLRKLFLGVKDAASSLIHVLKPIYFFLNWH